MSENPRDLRGPVEKKFVNRPPSFVDPRTDPEPPEGTILSDDDGEGAPRAPIFHDREPNNWWGPNGYTNWGFLGGWPYRVLRWGWRDEEDC